MNNYIKSPLNFVGGKYKLLSQILPLFPKNITTFVDLFGGGCNVGINIENCDKIIYNDNNKYVVDILRAFKSNHIGYILKVIDSYISTYGLSKTNKEGYLSLRKDYNNISSEDSLLLYTLICYSFNNQIRFNSKGEYNMPFGMNRSSFNPSLREKLIKFVEELHKKNIIILNMEFEDVLLEYNFNQNDFIYIDPPYLNSSTSYNEDRGVKTGNEIEIKGWSEEKEDDLLWYLDKLNEEGIRFALSNNLKYENPILDKWKDKYNIHYLNRDYSNCNYQKKDKSKDIEVLITNY